MAPGALALALLALAAPVGPQPPGGPSGAVEPADVVWRYDTGG